MRIKVQHTKARDLLLRRGRERGEKGMDFLAHPRTLACRLLRTCMMMIKTITVLYKPALWVLLMIGDGGLAVPDNPD